MTLQSYISPNQETSFRKFLFSVENRKYLYAGIGLTLISFIVFKLFYPYPDFFSDSYSYIYAADAQLDINIWPIGYSKFLALVHAITYSDTAVFIIQYLSLQITCLWLFFTLLFFYAPGKTTRNTLFIFLFINPLSLYLSNTINSDAIFATLSLLWLTELIWIIHRPRVHQLIVQAILLFLCIVVRNNAYYYPLITVLTVLLSKQPIKRKLIGLSLPCLLIIPFIIHTRNAAYSMTGVKQFSLFTGWQLANNALYMYDKIPVDSNIFVTNTEKELNRLSIAFFAKSDTPGYRKYLEAYVGNLFIKQSKSPLKQYYGNHYRIETENDQIIAWAKASESFESFGKKLLLHYPFSYARYFMLPNIRNYLLPPLSHIGLYNYGINNIDPIAQHWFHYPSPRVSCISHKLQGFLIVYTGLFLFINFYFLWELLSLFRSSSIMKLWKNSLLLITIAFLLANFLFSIFSTVNILRYQFVPMIVMFASSYLLSDYLKESSEIKKISVKYLKNKSPLKAGNIIG